MKSPVHSRIPSLSKVKSRVTPTVRCIRDSFVFYRAGALSTFILLSSVRIYSVTIYSKTIDVFLFFCFFWNFFFFKKETNSVYTLTVWVQEKNKASCCGFSNFSVSSGLGHSIFCCPSLVAQVFFVHLFFFENDTKFLENQVWTTWLLTLHCSCQSREWKWVSMLCKLAHAKWKKNVSWFSSFSLPFALKNKITSLKCGSSRAHTSLAVNIFLPADLWWISQYWQYEHTVLVWCHRH